MTVFFVAVNIRTPPLSLISKTPLLLEYLNKKRLELGSVVCVKGRLVKRVCCMSCYVYVNGDVGVYVRSMDSW